MRTSRVHRYFILLFLTVGILLISLTIGGNIDNPNSVISIILHKLFGFKLDENISSVQLSIVWNIRLPRVLLCFLVGGMLSISGVISQSILRNPLASSYTLGISSGASLGIGILALFNVTSSLIGYFLYPIVGFLFSIITILFVILICRKFDPIMSNNTIILVGMVLSLFLNAILTFIVSLSHENLSSILIWQMGSFSSRGWNYVISILPFLLIGLFCSMFFNRELDILTFGDDTSRSVGVNLPKIKIIMLICVSILTGASIACSGVIGFVDLIVPHISRKLFDTKHKIVIPVSFFIGGMMMSIFDIVSRVIIYPAEIPISTINALIGTPIFCYIFFKDMGGNKYFRG